MPNINRANTRRTVEKINAKIDRYEKDIWIWEEKNVADAEILIVACGCVSRSASEAMRIGRRAGHKVGLFRPITIWPFPTEPLVAAMAKAKTVIVPEMNRGQLVHLVREYAPRDVKIVPVSLVDGTVIMPEQIVGAIEEVGR